jgi:branched-chain amino acid transport system substrate-binding protein
MYKTRSLTFVMVIILTCALILSGCAPTTTQAPAETQAPVTQQPATTEPYLIGFAGPFSGSNAQYGEMLLNGANLAVDQINEAGGVNGRQIKLELGDDQMDSKQAPLVAQRFAQNPKVIVVIGHFASTNTVAAVPIYDREELAVVTAASTSPSLTCASPWFFRVPSTNKIQGYQGGTFSVKTLGAKRIAVMYAESDATQAMEEWFEKGVADSGGEIVAVETHQINDQDYTAQITKLKALNPELVYLNTYFNEGAFILKQAAEAGWDNTIFLGCDSVGGPGFLDLTGPEVAEGFYQTVFWDPTDPNEKSQKFVADFKAKYGEIPEQYAAHAYSAVYVVVEALKNGAETRQEIRDYLEKTGASTGFDVAIGKFVWDDCHEPARSVLVLKVVNGEFISSPEQPPPDMPTGE